MIKTNIHLHSLHLGAITLAAFGFLSVNEPSIEAVRHHEAALFTPVMREKEPIRFNLDIELPYRIPHSVGA